MAYSLEERELAQRIWNAKGVYYLTEQDQRRGRALGFIVSNMASNLCNDVRHGHGVVANPKS